MISTTDDNINEQDFSNYQSDNLIFVDTNLTNYQSLIPDTNNSNVVLIDSQENGIEEITTVLEQYSNLDSISIFSHGDVGSIQLGNTYLSNHNLDTYQDDLTVWGNALSPDGDLLLYGCNVGSDLEGLEFVDRVADLTNADVAASEDLTGNTELGGDWTLEVSSGSIETKTFALSEYGHLLDLQFNITYDEGVDNATQVAFEYAARAWSDVLGDDASINIHVTQANNNELPDNVLAGAVPSFVQDISYSDFRNNLVSDRLTGDDQTAVNNLETGSTWKSLLPGANKNISEVALTRANAKALDLIDSHSNQLDGIITVNDLSGTGVRWEHYRNQSVDSNEFDMATVAMHEIGHILGFVSAVDAITDENRYETEALAEAATSMDLFRYIRKNMRMMSLISSNVAQNYFSIDGGFTRITDMSNGISLSDEYQASHWDNDSNAGIMVPVAELGSRNNIKDLDLKALDVIGWDRITSTKSENTLLAEAHDIANNKGNINRNTDVNNMLEDWRWARRGSRDRLRQEGNISQFLAQEGFFNVGTFRSSFDFSSVNSVSDRELILIADQQFEANEFQSGQNSDLTNSAQDISEINVTDVVTEIEGIDYEQMFALVTEELSAAELSQLSLDDLEQLIEQRLEQPLASLVSALN